MTDPNLPRGLIGIHRVPHEAKTNTKFSILDMKVRVSNTKHPSG